MESSTDTILAPLLSAVMGLSACFLAAGGCLLCYRGAAKERKKLLENPSNVPTKGLALRERQSTGVTQSTNSGVKVTSELFADGFVVLDIVDETKGDSTERGHVDSPQPLSSHDSEYSSSRSQSSGDSSSPTPSVSESGFSEPHNFRGSPSTNSLHEKEQDIDHVPSFPIIAPVPSPPVPKPSVKLYVCYSRVMSLLSVRIVSVGHLPAKQPNLQCMTSAKVLPDWDKSKSTKIVKVKGSGATFQESLNFKPVVEEDLERATIRVCVHLVSEREKTFVGENFIRCVNLPLRSGKSYYLEETLKTRRPIRRSSANVEGDDSQDTGHILVVLQYDSALHRLQVTVQKAENLPARQGFSSNPKYYVTARLLEEGHVVEMHRSAELTGSAPAWGHSCLFNTSAEFSHSCSLELVVMRLYKYKKDSVVGQVIIGPNSSKTGASHWSEMLQPRATGSAKWHELTS